MRRLLGQIKRRRMRASLRTLRWQIGGGDFSIISDDCWAGAVYQHLELPYRTPFVGLYVRPAEYVQLLGDLRGHLTAPLEFIREPDITFPVARLRDVRLFFMHYHSEAEARDKWTRRLERVNWDRLFVKFDPMREPFDDALVQAWNAVAPRLPHPVCFTDARSHGFSHAVRLRHWMLNGHELFWPCQREFDLAAWLTGKWPRPAPGQRLLHLALHRWIA